MRDLILLPIISLLSCLSFNEDSRTIHIKDIGWQFLLPSGTLLKDSTFKKNGELTGTIPSEGPSLRLFVIKDSSLGTFSAYVRKDTLENTAWRNRHNSDTRWYFEQMRQLPKYTVLDTNYSTQEVSGIDFLVQHVKFIRKGNSDTGHVYHYFGRIKDNELNVSLEFFDVAIGKKYREIFNSSKFLD